MTPDLNRIYCGSALEVLRGWPDAFVHCAVTSPPYWGQRKYLPDDSPDKRHEIGREPTLAEYIASIVAVSRELKRVLRDDGLFFMNLGDSYTSGDRAGHGTRVGYKQETNRGMNGTADSRRPGTPAGLKPKDLCMVPARVAIALQEDGWWLRSKIIWAKGASGIVCKYGWSGNPMPESVQDRPTSAYEEILMLSKSERYFADMEAVKENGSLASLARLEQDGFHKQQGGPKDSGDGNRSHRKVLENLRVKADKQRGHSRCHAGFNDRWDQMEREEQCAMSRNIRNVWTCAPAQSDQQHFATFPEGIVMPCIKIGTSEAGVCSNCGRPLQREIKNVSGGREWKHGCGCGTAPKGKAIVLDPFMGSGTTALVAARLGRRFLGIELNPEYVAMAQRRVEHEAAQGKLL